jgi:predicted RNA-binding protein Jag
MSFMEDGGVFGGDDNGAQDAEMESTQPAERKELGTDVPITMEEEKIESGINQEAIDISLSSKKKTSTAKFVPKFAQAAPKQDTPAETAESFENVRDHVAVNNDVFELSGELDILEADGSLNVYWFDACETGGVVYLFGKVHYLLPSLEYLTIKALNRKDGKHISVCISVKNILRNIYVLPKSTRINEDGMEIDIEMQDVYDEFDQIRRKHGIRDFGCKFVKRNYAFEVPGVPAESDYLKVVYSFDRTLFMFCKRRLIF